MKSILTLAALVLLIITASCKKDMSASKSTTTNSFTINGTSYSVDHVYVLGDTIDDRALGTYNVFLIHGPVSNAHPIGTSYTLNIDSVSAQASGSYTLHAPNYNGNDHTNRCDMSLFDQGNVPNSLLYFSVNNSGTVTKTAARSFSFTGTVTVLDGNTTKTAKVVGSASF